MLVTVKEVDKSERVTQSGRESLVMFCEKGPKPPVMNAPVRLTTRQKFRMRRARRLLKKRLSVFDGMPNTDATRNEAALEIQMFKPTLDRLLFG